MGWVHLAVTASEDLHRRGPAIAEDFDTFYPGAHFSGSCFVEEDATPGPGCVTLPDIGVGRGGVVGARLA